jgi:putative MFS transporter
MTTEKADDLSGKKAVAGSGVLSVDASFARAKLTPQHFKVGFVLWVAFAVEAWEMLQLAYIASGVEAGLQITAAQLGLVISSLFFGMIPGALLWGPIVDRLGRRASCMWSLGIYGLITLASSLAPTFELLVAARVAGGFALVGLFVVVFVYFEELLPTRHRGTGATLLASGWMLGTVIALAVAGAIGADGWRWVIAVGGLGSSVWAFVIRASLPESPYWLVQVGRDDDARAALRQLRMPEVVCPARQDTPVQDLKVSAKELFTGRLLRRSVAQMAISLLLCWAYWGLQSWLPTLLVNRGMTWSGSLWFVFMNTLFGTVGYLSAAWMTGHFGRKRVFISYLALAVVNAAIFTTTETSTWLYIASCGLAFFSLGAFGVWNAWVPELYPTRVRGQGVSLGIFSQRVGTAIAPSVVGVLIATSVSLSATLIIIHAALIVTLLVALAVPETEGRNLS